MVRAKLKTPEGRKFLPALLVVFMIAAACVGRATIVGVIEQYNIPLRPTTSMYVLQSAMIFVYSLVFTVLLAIPLGIFFRVDVRSTKRRRAIRKPSCGWLLCIKTSHKRLVFNVFWSAREDLNLRPPTPHDGALPAALRADA